MNDIQTGLAADDLLLVPKYSDIRSRKEVDISNKLGTINLTLPIISSPMDSVTETAMAIEMSCEGGLGIIHRYCTIEQQVEMVKRCFDVNTPIYVGAAIGVTGDFLERANALIEAGVSAICIDIAHGFHILMKEALEKLNNHPQRSEFHLMAGNVADGDGFLALFNWGADSIRVSIGSGAICSTRLNTGFGVPNMSAIFDCVNKWEQHNTIETYDDFGSVETKSKNLVRPVLIIDGGAKNAGDIVKCLAAGADFVMCGSLLAGTDEAPGQSKIDNRKNFAGTPLSATYGEMVKVYRGMASRGAQTDFKGSSSAPEGIETYVACKGPLKPILDDLAGNIRSGFSYAGARNIQELRKKAHFIKQTHAGLQESFTHILNRR